MSTSQAIDKNARNRFLQEIKNTAHAGISELQTVSSALSLQAIRQEYLDGKRGHRDRARAAVLLEASKLRNGTAHVLAFFAAVLSRGFRGIEVTNEILASQIRAALCVKVRERTLRNALRALEAEGWINTVQVSTGTRVQMEGGKWRSLRVNKITFTPAVYMLTARRPVSIPHIRQNLPPIGEDRKQAKRTNDRSALLVSNSNDRTLSIVKAPQVDTISQEKEKEVLTTPPPAKRATIKQRAQTTAASGGKAPGKGALRFGRRRRNQSPKTYDAARNLLMHDIFAQTKNELFHRVAALQTDRAYPPLFFSALPWDNYLPRWIDPALKWADRRRIVKNEIVPALTAFTKFLEPPADLHEIESSFTTPEKRARLEASMGAYNRLKAQLESIPIELDRCDLPPRVRAIAEKYHHVLQSIPYRLNRGLLRLDQIHETEREIIRDIADAIGED